MISYKLLEDNKRVLESRLKDLGELKNLFDMKKTLENKVKELERSYDEKKRTEDAELLKIKARNKFAAAVDNLTKGFVK